jgi:iron(III) transport system substrate-binding protein
MHLMERSRAAAAVFCFTAMLLALVGCGDQAADAEQEILVYTAIEPEQWPVYVAAFEQAHPAIRVKVERDSTEVIASKFLNEAANPQADVIWGVAATRLMLARQRGLLEPFAPSDLSAIDPVFRDEHDPPAWVGQTVWMTAFCCNRIELQRRNLEPPRSFADLVEPRYQGLIVMPDPNSSGTGYLTVSAILQLMGEQEGWAYLDRLHENVLRYVHSGSKPARMAGAGEVPVGVSFGFRGFMQQQRGEPIEVIFPAEGSGWDMEASALVKKQTIKPAARTFLDWVSGPEAMALYAQHYAILSNPPTDFTPPAGFPDQPRQQLIANDFDWAAANKDRVLDEWKRRYGGKSDPQE